MEHCGSKSLRLGSAYDKYPQSTQMEKDSSEKNVWKQQFLF